MKKKRGICLETYIKAGQTPNLFLNFMRFHSMMGDFQKKDLLTEIELEAYFYFNKVPYHQKIRLVAHKLSYGGLNF